MIIRCQHPTAGNYNRYGGRGITVCEHWQDFRNFLADMGERPLGATIDRIDNARGYEPDNCRWATPREQVLNRAATRFIEFNGERLCKTDWARRIGITPFALNERLRKWPIERALTAPHGPFGPKPR